MLSSRYRDPQRWTFSLAFLVMLAVFVRTLIPQGFMPSQAADVGAHQVEAALSFCFTPHEAQRYRSLVSQPSASYASSHSPSPTHPADTHASLLCVFLSLAHPVLGLPSAAWPQLWAARFLHYATWFIPLGTIVQSILGSPLGARAPPVS
ncbi:MAG TPA: hypothetical protein H9906_06300 [Candidatus Paenalcaligenes intestinipullorum]|uniref:Uncharacterized protein n=1 Tax=Candidatus Paenalcaligenes intestinipullorum TaxID=2838718 RepID=A0A9D2RJQ7_9BURK|nr:hypothetical protein [Candidatus Paenalcaligenes intestinipullorum]